MHCALIVEGFLRLDLTLLGLTRDGILGLLLLHVQVNLESPTNRVRLEALYHGAI